MPQINEMDGVPEEPGFYLVKNNGKWYMAEVMIGMKSDNLIAILQGGTLFKGNFCKHTWSEKIEPPE